MRIYCRPGRAPPDYHSAQAAGGRGAGRQPGARAFHSDSFLSYRGSLLGPSEPGHKVLSAPSCPRPPAPGTLPPAQRCSRRCPSLRPRVGFPRTSRRPRALGPPSLPSGRPPSFLDVAAGRGEVGSQSCASAKARPLPTPGGSLPSASVASDGPDAWRVPRGTQVRAWLGRARGLNVRPGGGGGPASLVPGAQLGAPSRSRASPGRLRALRVDALPGRTHDSHAALSREWL